MTKYPVLFACFLWARPAGAAAPDYKVFFGNLHSHTSYSDGSGTPAEAFEAARDAGGLNFLAVTEHNHPTAEAGAGERRDGLLIAGDHSLYDGAGVIAAGIGVAGGAPRVSLMTAARRFTRNGRFVALYGQEYSTISQGNHVNVFDIAPVITVPNGRFDKLYEFLGSNKDSQGEPALVMLNHPRGQHGAEEYGEDDFHGRGPWIEASERHVRLIEVLSGPALKDGSGHRPAGDHAPAYLDYLSKGFHLGPTASQDNHYRNWGTSTESRTGVLAKRLRKKEILEALRARRVYATHDKNLKVWYSLGGHVMGTIAKAPAGRTRLSAEVRIEDSDEPGARYTAELLRGRIGGERPAVAARREISGDGTVAFEGIEYRGGREFFLVRLRQASQGRPTDKVWTAPVWLEP